MNSFVVNTFLNVRITNKLAESFARSFACWAEDCPSKSTSSRPTFEIEAQSVLEGATWVLPWKYLDFERCNKGLFKQNMTMHWCGNWLVKVSNWLTSRKQSLQLLWHLPCYPGINAPLYPFKDKCFQVFCFAPIYIKEKLALTGFQMRETNFINITISAKKGKFEGNIGLYIFLNSKGKWENVIIQRQK